MRDSDRLIDMLIADLSPVCPTSSPRLLALVALLVGVEGGIVWALGDMRADLARGVPTVILAWRLLASAAFAGLAATMAIRLRSLRPTTDGRPWLLAVALLALATGLAVDMAYPSALSPLVRMRWKWGLHCVLTVVANGLPVLGLIAILLRRGATIRPIAASAWAGLAAAASGGFVWALACPIDDPVYVIVWYALAFALLTGVARWLLPAVVKLRPGR